LRRLLRVASRYDVDRPHLKALLPSSSARGDDVSEKTTLRDLVRRTVRDPAGYGLSETNPERRRAVIRRNLIAMEYVFRRAETSETSGRPEEVESEGESWSAPSGTPPHPLSTATGSRRTLPRVEMVEVVRRAIDVTLRDVSDERLACITNDARGEAWMRRAGERETARRRGEEFRGGVKTTRRRHPNARWYAGRLDALLADGETERERDDYATKLSREEEMRRTRNERNPSGLVDDITRLFREMRDVGCPVSVKDAARAVAAVASFPRNASVSFGTNVGATDDLTSRDAREERGGCDGTSALASVLESKVDAALVLAWRCLGDADEGARIDPGWFEASASVSGTLDRDDAAVSAAFDAVVLASATSAGLTSWEDASVKRTRVARAVRLVHASLDLVRSPGRDAAAEAVVVAAGFVADEKRKSRERKTSFADAGGRLPLDFSNGSFGSQNGLAGELSYASVSALVDRMGSRDPPVGIAPRAWRALLRAAECEDDLGEAFGVLERWKRSGHSPDADAVFGILEWASETGDDGKIEWLESELMQTGKGAYLARLNAPGC
jgi:hypothetical protein